MKSSGSVESDSRGLMMGAWRGCISVALMLIVGVGDIGVVAWPLRGRTKSAEEGDFDVISCDRGVVDSRSVTLLDGRGWLVVKVRGRMRRERRVVRWKRGVGIFAMVHEICVLVAEIGCIVVGIGWWGSK